MNRRAFRVTSYSDCDYRMHKSEIFKTGHQTSCDLRRRRLYPLHEQASVRFANPTWTSASAVDNSWVYGLLMANVLEEDELDASKPQQPHPHL